MVLVFVIVHSLDAMEVDPDVCKLTNPCKRGEWCDTYTNNVPYCCSIKSKGIGYRVHCYKYRFDYCEQYSPCKNQGTCENLLYVSDDRVYRCHCPNSTLGRDCEISQERATNIDEMISQCCAKSLHCENYRGKLNQTASGRTCQRWDKQTPHEHKYNQTNYPDDGLEENYCRNPSNHHEAWCYTTDSEQRWERCALPDCLKKYSCKGYRGKQNVTASGIPCQRWDKLYPRYHKYLPKKYPKAGLEKNYCRNPSNHVEAWCYTMSGNKAWERCALPDCLNEIDITRWLNGQS